MECTNAPGTLPERLRSGNVRSRVKNHTTPSLRGQYPNGNAMHNEAFVARLSWHKGCGLILLGGSEEEEEEEEERRWKGWVWKVTVEVVVVAVVVVN
ncbi:uncharacterized protein LAJ45_07762 [Morchella importuna]|uniref:uncharacterized protein n=1 Tax=Morchella importuna TaxID=1174673 RepID=UPI001E8ED20E|nr:uncharacterized protein LAJ45_07762 [Morchella importuna]KAH8148309.1 hypothetical protein LAJ45_07762 [Morchella importuna]